MSKNNHFYNDIKGIEVKAGDRIELEFMLNDPAFNKTILKGDRGMVKENNKIPYRNEHQIWVQFDSGSYLALISEIDTFKVLTESEKAEEKKFNENMDHHLNWVQKSILILSNYNIRFHENNSRQTIEDDIGKNIQESIAELEEKGLISEKNDSIVLLDNGQHYANYLTRELRVHRNNPSIDKMVKILRTDAEIEEIIEILRGIGLDVNALDGLQYQTLEEDIWEKLNMKYSEPEILEAIRESWKPFFTK